MDDVKGTMSKSDMKEKPKIEEALGKYCKRKDNGPRERKICVSF